MTFRETADLLCLTAPELADLFGVRPQTVRQWRLDEDSPSYRRPPDGWQAVLAPIARKRGAALAQLAERLERAGR